MSRWCVHWPCWEGEVLKEPPSGAQANQGWKTGAQSTSGRCGWHQTWNKPQLCWEDGSKVVTRLGCDITKRLCTLGTQLGQNTGCPHTLATDGP